MAGHIFMGSPSDMESKHVLITDMEKKRSTHHRNLSKGRRIGLIVRTTRSPYVLGSSPTKSRSRRQTNWPIMRTLPGRFRLGGIVMVEPGDRGEEQPCARSRTPRLNASAKR